MTNNMNMTKTMEELYDAASEAVIKMNDAVASDSAKAIAGAKEVMTKAFSLLNNQVIVEAFDKFLAEENPMLAAITQGYMTLYAPKNERNKLTGAESWKIDKKENNVIDIISFVVFII